jgi:hypothetical protein
VEINQCPAGYSCSGTREEPCENKISKPETGKCVSCEDGEFAHTSSNTCVECPREREDQILVGVECADGRIQIKDDFFIVPAAQGDSAPLGPETMVLRCRDKSVCSTIVDKADFTARTVCLGNTTGPLCGACQDGFARRSPQGACDACPGSAMRKGPQLGPMSLLVTVLVIFAFLYRQCIKYAMRNARHGHKGKFMTFSVLKIVMAFLFKTSLLSHFQLDWGALMRWVFQVNSVASSGDPTTVTQAQCFGLDLHAKMKLLVAAPFIIMLLPLPLLAKARFCLHKSTVFGVPLRDAYWAAVLIGWWLLHPAILSQALSALLTLSVGDKAYALADLSVETTDPAYVHTRSLAIVLLATFVPAVPLYVFATLHRWRSALRNPNLEQRSMPEPARIRMFYFYGSYAPERYYWEVVVFATRTAMVVLSSLSAATVDKSSQQVVIFFTTWVCLIHFLLVFKFEPYSRKVESQVNKLAQFVLLALLLCALGLSTDEADGVFATTVRAFCASLVLVVVVVVVHVFVVQFRMKSAFKKSERKLRAGKLTDAAVADAAEMTLTSTFGDDQDRQSQFTAPNPMHDGKSRPDGFTATSAEQPVRGSRMTIVDRETSVL